MIACPQCQHPNPEGATQCEACFQDLPTLLPCPHCGVAVQSDAVFCGQCGNAITLRPSLTEPNSEPLTVGIALESFPSSEPTSPLLTVSTAASTQLPPEKARLFHELTGTTLPLPNDRALVHIGKPNDRTPPDLDLSGFPGADIVSRVHAVIRVEEDCYFLEDVGSANGTYVNQQLLPLGDRHRLRPGDRIAFGKGNLVTFIFQLDP